MRPSLLCHRLYEENGRERLCTLPKHHKVSCDGHETSRDLVPTWANKRIIPFVGTIFFWQECAGVWLAYANPPHDVMAQGRPGGGHDAALASLMRTIRANRLIGREFAMKQGTYA